MSRFSAKITGCLGRRALLRKSVGVGIASTIGVRNTRIATAAEGDELWRFKAGSLIVSSPTVVDNTVYFGTNGSDVYAVDAETGEEQWQFEAGRYINATPTVVDEVLYISSNDQHIYALDRTNGEELWRFDTGDVIRSSPTVADGTVFVGNGDFGEEDTTGAGLYAVDAISGEQQWQFETNARISSSPVVKDGIVLFGSYDGNVYALDSETGEQRWASETGGGRSSPTVTDETVYIGGWQDGNVYAFDVDSGDLRWEFETDDIVSSSPTVATGSVFVGSADNNVYAIDADSGEPEWVFETGSTVASSPTIVGERVFIGSGDGNVYALDSTEGSELWRFETNDEVSSSPIVVDGVLYIGSREGRDEGTIYALEAGIDGSSEGSRAHDGSLNHHETWRHAGQDINIDAFSEGDNGATNPVAAIFRRASEDTGLVGTILAAGIASGGYLTYKWRQSSKESDEKATETTGSVANPSHAGPGSGDVGISSYSEFDFRETVRKESQYRIDTAVIGDDHQSVWVLKYDPQDDETVDKANLEELLGRIEPWTKFDDHPHLISVYGYGTEPLPWVAVEPADYPTLIETAADYSLSQRIGFLIETCEAVHHVSRYGFNYDVLVPESLLIAPENMLKLRGVLDYINPTENSAYEPPGEIQGQTTESALVYRLGAIGYELLSGHPPDDAGSSVVLPSERNPELSEGIDRILLKSIATDPDERYETVLHLRDNLSAVVTELDI